MANSAPYEVNVTGTDDETFMFSIPFENDDGSPFAFSDYSIEYAVSCDGTGKFTLSEGDGITVADGAVTFKRAMGSLGVGLFKHGCRIKHLATGDYFQVFDGSVTIGEGNF